MVFLLATTWRTGRQHLVQERERDPLPLETFIASIRPDHPPRVPGMLDATEFFRIPTNRVIELGGQIEI